MLGGEIRQGDNVTGIFTGTVADGETPTPATPGNTDITVGATDAGDDTDYWGILTSPTTMDIFWLDLFSGIAPSPTPIPGVTFNYIGLAFDPAQPPADIATAILGLVLGIPGYSSISILGDGITLRFVTNLLNTRLASVFSVPVPWSGTFVDGTAAEVGHPEIAQIVYEYAIAKELHFKYFTMTDAANNIHLYYYIYNGATYDPTNLGISYDFAHPVNLIEKGTNSDVHRETNNVIGALGIWTNIYDENLVTRWSLPDANPADINGGTAQIGSDNVVTDLIAPDGAVLGTGYVTAEDYQNAWNTIVYDYMAIRGGTYYLKAVSRSGNCPEMPPCSGNCSPVGDPETYCHCDTCPPAGAVMMMRTTHFAVTGLLPYNIPPTSFVMDKNKKAPGAYI